MRMILILLTILVTGGCNKQEDPPVQPPPNQPVQVGGNNPAPQGLARRMRRVEYLRELGQLAFLYRDYVETHRRAPPSLEAFKKANQRDAAKLMQVLDEGYYTMNLKARPNTNQIVAYETTANEDGQVIAARLDGSVHTLTVAELQAELANP